MQSQGRASGRRRRQGPPRPNQVLCISQGTRHSPLTQSRGSGVQRSMAAQRPAATPPPTLCRRRPWRITPASSRHLHMDRAQAKVCPSHPQEHKTGCNTQRASHRKRPHRAPHNQDRKIRRLSQNSSCVCGCIRALACCVVRCVPCI